MMEREELVSLALGRVRAEFTPSPADKARHRAALGFSGLPAVAPGVPPTVASAVPHGEPSRWAALKASGLLGIGLGASLLLGGVGFGFRWGEATAVRREPPQVAAVAHAEMKPAAAVLPELVPELVKAETVAPGAARPRPVTELPRVARAERIRSAATPERSTARPLVEELALLRRVERALRSHDAALALALLRELDQRFPETRLGEERLAARHIADCQQSHADPLGHAAALREARRFVKEHPASVYSERLQTACGFTGEGH